MGVAAAAILQPRLSRDKKDEGNSGGLRALLSAVGVRPELRSSDEEEDIRPPLPRRRRLKDQSDQDLESIDDIMILEPDELMPLGATETESNAWAMVEATVDSGSAVSGIPRRLHHRGKL